ncbi:MAG: ribonuclease Z [Candidatus Diapherotrites archaeon]|nr:ribonuclease Z [Candidatus Diapherotrites archaeon]
MNPVEIVFLGTAASAPTETRNLSAMALRSEGEWFLFDCPEGCQQQMLRSGVSYMKTSHIFLTHLHLDHVLGIPGLVATLQMHARIHPLFLYCPEQWKPKLQKILSLAPKTDFDVQIKGVTRGVVLKTDDYTISCVPLRHEIDCVGYIFEQTGKDGEFQRKKAEALKIPEGPLWAKLSKGEKIKHNGKTIAPEAVMDYSKSKNGAKIAYIVDTIPVMGNVKALQNATVLVHEATFLEKDADRAKQTGHSTAKQAGAIAAKAEVRQLILTHFSARHKELEALENECRMEFARVHTANDLERFTIHGEEIK